MLVLSRKPGEFITIGDSIKITVIESRGGKVRIGIEAPREVPVVRGELLQYPVCEHKPEYSQAVS